MARKYRIFPSESKQHFNLFLLLLSPVDSAVLALSTLSIRALREKMWIVAFSMQLLRQLVEDHHCVVRFLSFY